MKDLAKAKFSPPMIVAMIALGVALSGSAVAVTSNSGSRAGAAAGGCDGGMFDSRGQLKKECDAVFAKNVNQAVDQACRQDLKASIKAAAYNGPVSPCTISMIRKNLSAQHGQINTKMIAANAVKPKTIASDAITAAKLAPSSIGTNAIMNNAITSSLITAQAITATQLANNSVFSSAIADNAVRRSAIAGDAVGPAQVEDVKLGNLARNAGWTTSAENPTHYVIDAEGVVHLRGILFRADGANGIAFQLPPGIRPGGQSDREMPVIGAGSGCGGVSTPVSAYIQGNGAPGIEGGVSFSPVDCSYYHLDGISYVP